MDNNILYINSEVLLLIYDFIVDNFTSVIEELKNRYIKILGTISLDPTNPNIRIPTHTFFRNLQLLDIDDTNTQFDIFSHIKIFLTMTKFSV